MKFSFLIQIVLVFSSLVFLGACNGKEKTKETDTSKVVNPEMDEFHKANEERLMSKMEATPEEKAKDLQSKRAHAAALIDKRSKEESAYSMLTAFYYEWEFVFGGQGGIKAADPGTWYKFEEDFTYQYGQYDKVNGGGRYHLNLDHMQLITRDNDDKKMPEEWQVMVKEDVMVLVGKEYFANNPIQIKMQKRVERPQKS